VTHYRSSADRLFVKLGEGLKLGTVMAAMLLAASTRGVFGQQPAAAPPAKPDPNAISDARAAIGEAGLLSIRYRGAGTMVIGAPDTVTTAAQVAVTSYEVSIDYPSSAMEVDVVPATGEPAATAASAGAQTHQVESINGTVAWDATLSVAPVAPGGKKAHGKPNADRTVSVTAPPTLNASAGFVRRQAIWATPHGFLKAALTNQPALQPAGAGTDVSFYAGANRYVGFLNSKHQVERVRTWVRRPAGGDVLLDTTYTGYAVFGAISFPTHIRQSQNGREVLDVTVSAVEPNAPVHVAVPKNVEQTTVAR
jgi:hypothetical protein